MKKTATLLIIILCISGLRIQAQAVYGEAFIHQAVPSNTFGHYTVINHAALIGNPGAVFLVEQNFNPNNALAGMYNNHNYGVYYTGANWAIFNQDIAPIDSGVAFNILIPFGGAGDAFKVISDALNTVDNYVYVDHPDLNNNQSAVFFVTQNFEPNDMYNDQSIGVWYDIYTSMWAIYNESTDSVAWGTAFNVFVPGNNSQTFIHSTSSSNITVNWSTFSEPGLAGEPLAFVFTTHNWNPTNPIGTYYEAASGVWYANVNHAVFRQDGASMDTAIHFNVLYEFPDTTTGISEQPGWAEGAIVFPNPASESAQLVVNLAENAEVTLDVFNTIGQKIYSLPKEFVSAGKMNTTIHVADFPEGIYICSLMIDDRPVALKLVVKK